MLKRWEKRGEETLFVNPWWKYKKDAFEIEDGTTGEYHYVDSPGSVMIIPIRADGRIVLVRQYRFLNARVSIEFPGGGLLEGVAPADMARKELREETGLDAKSMDEIASFNPFNGVTNEMCRVFVARGLSIVTAQADETEDFELLPAADYEIDALITEGELWDGMTLAAWNLYKLHSPAQHFVE